MNRRSFIKKLSGLVTGIALSHFISVERFATAGERSPIVDGIDETVVWGDEFPLLLDPGSFTEWSSIAKSEGAKVGENAFRYHGFKFVKSPYLSTTK